MQTRRGFIGSLTAALAVPSVGLALPTAKSDDWFEDIRVDRYYVLQGGQYGDTGGYGQPGYSMAPELLRYMEYWEHCRELEDKLDDIERNGYYLTPSSYLEKPHRRYDKMPLTKKWMMEFYIRHKDDKHEDWQKRYGDYLEGLR